MNRFVVAEPLWCTGCNTCLAACSDVHKTQGLQQHPRLALYWLQALRRGLPIWRNQRFRKPSGECPCAICFSG